MSRTATDQALYFLRWQLLPVLAAVPSHLAFALRGIGQPVGFGARSRLALSCLRIHLGVECSHNPNELLHVVEEIVRLPATSQGIIVECGAAKGGSSAKLSLAAAAVGRQLIVCDSFEGLPEASTQDDPFFRKGEYRGRLEEVQANVQRYGHPSGVRYVSGWFDRTLPQLAHERIACAFWDVDLQDSFRTCITHLWPLVEPAAKVYLHDVDRPAVAAVFLDSVWWRREMDQDAPRFVGSSGGLGMLSPKVGFIEKEVAHPHGTRPGGGRSAESMDGQEQAGTMPGRRRAPDESHPR